MSALPRCASPALLFLLGLALLPPALVRGAFINFDNCLSTSIVDSSPLELQWIPLWVDARFERTSPYNLNVTIYGNVSGQQVEGTYPAADSPDWTNPNDTFGKIVNIGTSGNYTTLLADFKVLTYNAYDAKATEFCPAVINGTCPLGPYFNANDTNPATLPAFSVAHDFGSPYIFSTLAGTFQVLSGDTGAPTLACVTANITPDLGGTISGLLCWLPAAILIVKGVATLSAAIWSPWGSADIFRWSSNFGRDEDQLRLVTPGFGDCLQYIQFVTLTGALSLQYPGFYQPAVSQASWSLLLFNESYVTHGSGTQSLVDGIYKYNGTYGMTAMSQLIGMTSVQDMWACMAIWLMVIAGIVLLLCQLGFLSRWIYRAVTNTTEEDLRSKNLPFTLGNVVRLMFNFFILPIVSLSLFQLVISGDGSLISIIVSAVVLLVVMILSAGWILRIIFTTKPRSILFDDMPTVLLYGPLYNTYSDSAAPFALIPVFITFVRAVALGAVQPSGIGQIIILAICEVILILTLNGFRPFQNQTSMNAYHTFFSVVRLVTVLLSIAFVATLGVSEATKGWIGYAILLLHAGVLVFGFFLNALQTLIEVIARSCGVAGDAQTGAIRGSILNMRMLKKRQNRANSHRGSMTSNAAILQDTDAHYGGRSRSMSASSQQLLNQVGTATTPSVHRLSGFENFSSAGEAVSSPSADTDGAPSYTGGILAAGATKSGKPGLAVKTAEAEQTFYRPPRPRRTTLEPLTPGARTRKSGSGSDYPFQDSPDSGADPRTSSYEAAFGRESPAPAYFRDRPESNENLPRTDYAVREVDQYYRGAALSDMPTRKLKTGPADPEGPAASAQSWIQRLMFGVKGKQKEQSKGFEVVRSSRMPRNMQSEDPNDALEMQTSPAMHQDSYRDSPDSGQREFQAVSGAERSVSPEQDDKPIQRGFDFGLDGSADRPGRQDSRRRGGAMPPMASNSGIIRTESGRLTYAADGVAGDASALHRESGALGRSNTAQSRPSAETGSDYDRPRSESSDESSSPAPYRTSEVPSLGPIESVGGLDLPSRFNSRRSTNLDHIDKGSTQGGQDWLRAVDSLEWSHPGRTPARQSSYTDSTVRGPPVVPSRSTRRTSSQDVTPAVNPRNRIEEDLFEGFDSGGGRTSPGFLTALAGDERPSSYASVNHHRAADSISRNSFGANAALQGASAEIFGETPPHQSGFADGR